MSVDTSHPETAECALCGGDRDPHASVAGSYCSTACVYRTYGRRMLNKIADDHRYCATCFRQIKECERPTNDELASIDVPKSIRDAFVGFKYPTEYTRFEETVIEKPIAGWDSPHRKVRGTWSCECGTIETHVADETLQTVEGGAVLTNLLAVLWQLWDDGVTDHRVDKDRLFDGIRSEGDLEYAIGYALRGDRHERDPAGSA